MTANLPADILPFAGLRPLSQGTVPPSTMSSSPRSKTVFPDVHMSDDLFRAYVETANDIVYTLDLEGLITFMNPYGLRLLDYAEKDVIGRPYLDVVAPESRASTAEAFTQLLQTGELREFEFILQTRQGARIMMEVNGRLLYCQNKLVGGLGIARDVTERKRFEAQLQQFSNALNSARDAVIITDLEGRITYANLATTRIFGYGLESLEGQNASLLYPNPQQSDWILRQAADHGWSGQVVCRREGGEPFSAFISIGPVQDERGVTVAVSVILRDISDLEQMKAELAAKNLELARANRLKSEFLTSMSHELRVPLTSVLGFSSLLEQQLFGPLNERQLLYVHQIHQSGEHLLDLINEVLDLSKVEAGQMNLDISPIMVADLCQNLLAAVTPQVQEKRLTLSQQIEPDLPLLMADELRVRQMLLNLLSNAIKFSEEGGMIGLDVHQAGEELLLTVWDQGIGIPMAQQGLLFHPFQQIDGDLTWRPKGTGLGLYLTQRLAHLHKGRVTFTSKPEQGSRFTLHLPIVTDATDMSVVPTVTSLSRTDATVAEGNYRGSAISGEILLVEDHPVNALLLEHMLHYWGYLTHHAATVADALQWLHSHRPNLIFVDSQLPLPGSLEMLRQIRANPDWQQIPIVAMGVATQEDWQPYEQAGMQDYLSKPINSARLVSVLAKYTWR